MTSGRNVIVLSVVIAACLLAGCGSSSKTSHKKTPVFRRAGPIAGLVAGVGHDHKGRPVGASPVFRPNTPTITIVAQIGVVRGSPLTFTWYQQVGSSFRKLFAQTLDVKSLDRAYSVGKNPGTLATGTYRVTAATEGATQRIEIVVRPERLTSASDPPASSGPPKNGGGGVVPAPQPAQSPVVCVGAEACGVILASNENGALDVSTTADLPASSIQETIETSAGITALRPIGRFLASPGAHVFSDILVDPCALPGGSDLPGTPVRLEAHGSRYSDARVVMLGPDIEGPTVSVRSSPGPGSRVKEGEQIEVSVTATEINNEYWQTGVRRLSLLANDAKVFETKPFGSGPRACTQKSWKESWTTSYTVPSSPPADIELCARASDWASYLGEQCADFVTGKVWEGPIHLDAGVTGDNSNDSGTGDGTIMVTEEKNGQLDGRLLVHRTSGCDKSPGQKSFNVHVRGEATKDKLIIRSTPNEVVTDRMGEPICGFPDGFFGDQGEQGSPIAPFVVHITSPTTATGSGTISDVESPGQSYQVNISTRYTISLHAH